PKDHCDERRDEVERLITALIKDERRFARKEIQEPKIKLGREVRVLVPMRREPGEVRPIGGHAHALPIEIGRWQWMQREREPISEQDTKRGEPLRTRLREIEQEQKRITQADLREHVREYPFGVFARCGRE